MKLNTFVVFVITFCCMSFYAAKTFHLHYPKYFPAPVYDFKTNPLQHEIVELGRALFYDPILSKDQTISCASCHSPFNSFAHTDHALSHGIHDLIGTRNAPALINLAWNKSFMWDGAIRHLDVQPLFPINHPKEMDESIENLLKKLEQSKLYPKLFEKAFKDGKISGEHVLKALAQFQLTLISANSKYDRVRQGKEQFTDQEQNGYRLFQKNCNACHTEPLFTYGEFANNGLPVDTTLNDYGKWKITKLEKDSLLFKVPTLRNLTYTYPYMHDGRFKKLNQVLNHYTGGIQQSNTLSPELKTPIQLTSNEKTDLLAFLLTLNDPEFTFDRKHQFPLDILH